MPFEKTAHAPWFNPETFAEFSALNEKLRAISHSTGGAQIKNVTLVVMDMNNFACVSYFGCFCPECRAKVAQAIEDLFPKVEDASLQGEPLTPSGPARRH